MPFEVRKLATVYDKETDEVRIAPNFLGKVYEVRGQQLTGRNFRLQHAVMIAERSDLIHTNCVVDI